MTFVIVAHSSARFGKLSGLGTNASEAQVNIDGARYVVRLEWNVKHEFYNVRIMTSPSRDHVAKFVASVGRPFLIKGFSSRRPTRPDALVMFVPDDPSIDKVTPDNLGVSVQMVMLHGRAE